MKIEPQQVVSLTYNLYVDKDGKEELVEQTTEEQPLTFIFGAGQMLPKFEDELATLSINDSFDFHLAAADAYGEHDEEAIANLPKEMFEEAGVPPIGTVIPLQDNEGHHFQGQVVSVAEDAVIVDLNHPMAGQQLHFKGKIINIRAANEEELSHGHAHGTDGHHGH